MQIQALKYKWVNNSTICPPPTNQQKHKPQIHNLVNHET